MGRPPDNDISRAKVAARAEKKRVTEESTRAFLAHFAANTERGTVLSAVAYLDMKVEFFIRQALLKDNADIDLMLRPDGALGSLASKIRLCWLLGYVKDETLIDLKEIVWIRNQFAHQLLIDSFENPTIATACSKLRAFNEPELFFGNGDIDEGLYQIKFYTDFGWDLKNHRWGFVAATTFLGNQFLRHQHIPLSLLTNFVKKAF